MRFVTLNRPLPESLNQKLTPAQQRVILALDNDRVLPFRTLLKEANVGATTVATLQTKGLLTVSVQAVRRDPFDGAIDDPATNHVLTQAQQAVLDEVESAREGIVRCVLLHGVTEAARPKSTSAQCRLPSTAENPQ